MKMEKIGCSATINPVALIVGIYRTPLGRNQKTPSLKSGGVFLLKVPRNAKSGVLVAHFLDNGFRIGNIIGGFAAHHLRFAAGVLGSLGQPFLGF